MVGSQRKDGGDPIAQQQDAHDIGNLGAVELQLKADAEHQHGKEAVGRTGNVGKDKDLLRQLQVQQRKQQVRQQRRHHEEQSNPRPWYRWHRH